jgi:hypothetical protein
MQAMVEEATSFDKDVSSWKTSSVVIMRWAFWVAPSFNKDLSRRDVSGALDLFEMFKRATDFGQKLCASGNQLPTSADVTDMFHVLSTLTRP